MFRGILMIDRVSVDENGWDDGSAVLIAWFTIYREYQAKDTTKNLGIFFDTLETALISSVLRICTVPHIPGTELSKTRKL